MGGILRRRSGKLKSLLLVASLVAACASAGKVKEARYRPAENLLDILADFQRHLKDDSYRYETAKDITGKNINKATLVRLENYENTHPNKMAAIVYFSRAKALERLHDYEGAGQAYQRVAKVESKLQELAERNFLVCLEFQQVRDAFALQKNGEIQDRLLELDRQTALWRELVEKYHGNSYESLAREEEEQVNQAKVRFLMSSRGAIENGNAQVILAYQKIINRHAQSKNIDHHLLGLADFHVILAQEYVQEHDPEGLGFNLAVFRRYTDPALQLYGAIAKERYGKLERLEAKGSLMALKAFVNRVATLAQ